MFDSDGLKIGCGFTYPKDNWSALGDAFVERLKLFCENEKLSP